MLRACVPSRIIYKPVGQVVTHTFAHTRTSSRTHACTHTCTCTCIHTHIYTNTHVHAHRHRRRRHTCLAAWLMFVTPSCVNTANYSPPSLRDKSHTHTHNSHVFKFTHFFFRSIIYCYHVASTDPHIIFILLSLCCMYTYVTATIMKWGFACAIKTKCKKALHTHIHTYIYTYSTT
jgi:hypothetical protein